MMISERRVQRVPGTARGRRFRLLTGAVLLFTIAGSAWADNLVPVSEGPSFTAPITNVTVPVGKEAILSCSVANLSTFMVEWWDFDTKTILTVANRVLIHNDRISITHSENTTWLLHIRNVNESDRGNYMCQINTQPVKRQICYLEIGVPPNILDYQIASTEMIVRESNNVSLRCEATGTPTPNITLRREDSELIILGNSHKVASIEGPVFNITKVNRLQTGAYLCIASNGVLPTVSKRIMLNVHFTPMIWIQNELVGVQEGDQITLECYFEAFPKPIYYWMRENPRDAKDVFIKNGKENELSFSNNVYEVRMKFMIRSVKMSSYGIYKCVSENWVGKTDGSIKLYHIPTPTTEPTTTSTLPIPTTVELVGIGKKIAMKKASHKMSSQELFQEESETQTDDVPLLQQMLLLQQQQINKKRELQQMHTALHLQQQQIKKLQEQLLQVQQRNQPRNEQRDESRDVSRDELQDQPRDQPLEEQQQHRVRRDRGRGKFRTQ